jgi:sarcosine oxidase subunit gamma
MTEKTTGIDIRIRQDLGHINLRGRATNSGFIDSVESCLGQPLPREPNTCTNGEHLVCWLGPDEWLVMTDIGSSPALASELAAGLGDIHTAVNDVSGGQVSLQMTGDAVRKVFAKGCTLDFHPRVFLAGMCAQSSLARASVLFALPDTDGEFHVVVRRSFADYLLRWLQDAGSAHGVRIGTS